MNAQSNEHNETRRKHPIIRETFKVGEPLVIRAIEFEVVQITKRGIALRRKQQPAEHEHHERVDKPG